MRKKLTKKMLTRYKNRLFEEEKSSATIEKYLRDMQKFYDFLPSGKRVDKEQVCSFKAYLASRYRMTSVNSMLAAVNHFLGFAGWDSFKVKQVRVQKQMFRAEEKELNAAEYKRLLKAAVDKGDERLYLIMLTICSTGIRVSELPHITKEALDLQKAKVSCKNKTRIVLLPGATRNILLAYAKKHNIQKGSIFLTRSGKAVKRQNIWRQMKELGALAGVAPEKIFPHNLRHLFARTYYNREKDIVKLADILGHSSIETARIYTCTTTSEHRTKIDRLGLMPIRFQRPDQKASG